MRGEARVFTAPSSDTDPSIAVSFADGKYVFNVPEATKRATLQSKHSWKRTRAVFLSSVSLDRTGGLAGLLMSMADSELPQLDVMGPEGTTHLLAASRLYTYRTKFAVYSTEVSSTPDLSGTPNPIYKDEFASVYALPILPTFTDSPSTSASDSLKRKRTPSPDAASKRPFPQSLSLEALADPSLTPLTPNDEVAQEWRRQMVRNMFPDSKQTRQNVATKTQQKKEKWDKRKQEKARKAVDGQIAGSETDNGAATEGNFADDEYRRRVRPHRGFFSQLPTFVPYSVEESLRPTIAYVIVGPRVRGKFDAAKAEALGIPPGPLRGKLAKGQTVTIRATATQPERVVRPEEIVAPTEAPSVVIILDVPTREHAKGLARQFRESPFYRGLFAEDGKERDYLVRTVFHTVGSGVLECEEYRDFMQAFGPDVHHIIASRAHAVNPVTFTSYASTLLRLNAMDSSIFPVPKFSLANSQPLPALPGIAEDKLHLMASSLTVPVRPPGPPSVEALAEDKFHPRLDKPVELLAPTTKKIFTEVKAAVSAREAEKNEPFPGSDVEVTTLGTGSALPTKYRNVLSNLIRIPGWGSVLLDCGEGTWGQLARQFGEDGAADAIRDLKCIFVSHVHGDHHMGLTKLLWKRRQLDPPPTHPLYLVTIRAVHLYVREMSDLFDLGLVDAKDVDKAGPRDVVTVMSEALHWRQQPAYPTSGRWAIGGDEEWTEMAASRRAGELMRETLGLERFRTIDVWHRTRCFGCQLKHKDRWSIVFSGDTTPAEPLVHAGQDATLVIHEASMADDQEETARQKAHSTVGQALAIARRMHAKHVLLTHFSARYPKMPPPQSLAAPTDASVTQGDSQVVALAFDHACMKIGDLWKMQLYMPAIEQAFYETKEEDADEEVIEGAAGDASGAVEVDIV